jgi:hypothetical protein
MQAKQEQEQEINDHGTVLNPPPPPSLPLIARHFYIFIQNSCIPPHASRE